MSTSSKRKQYADYYDDYLRTGKIPAVVTPFTKIEKMSTSKYKAPRMIQGRHMIFNLHYGRFIKPLEKLVTKYNPRTNGLFGKGNYDEQARKIHELSKRFKYFTEADHKTFDSHETVEHLKTTHRFYNKCYPQHKREISRLARRTIINTCFSRTGDSYRVKGTRMSGDVDTGFGNCLINYAILSAALEAIGIFDYEIIVNGDDSIIFTNVPIPIELFTAALRKYNMETEIKPSTTNIHEVEFCRTKLVMASNGQPTMMIDPERLIDIYGMSYTISEKKYHDYLLETAMCNAYINSNNPLGVLWAKYFNIDLENYKKNEKAKQRMLESIGCMEKDKKLKMLSLASDTVCDGTINNTMVQAWPSILTIEDKIAKLADVVLNKKYRYKKTSLDIIINHDTKSLSIIS